jgi:hypothetical protein
MKSTQENLHVKIWLSADKQSELGYWPTSQPDNSIWEELKAQGHDGTGTIIETTADWSADMSDEILENQPKKGQ